MKKLFFFILLLSNIITIGQVKPANKIPLYKYSKDSTGVAKFYDNLFKDTVRVIYSIEVFFDKPFSSKIKNLKVSDVKVTRLVGYNMENKINKPIFDIKYNCIPEYYLDFWDRYSNYIKEFHKQLNYQKMVLDDYEGYKRIAFGAVFLLIPENVGI